MVPDLRGLNLRNMFQLMEDHQIKIQVKGSGIVVKQFPDAGSNLDKSKTWKVELSGRS